jgi:hypothetical protein
LVGNILGISGAYARELAYRKKPLNRQLVERWLMFTGEMQRTHVVNACPDCAGVHTGRCHGRPVARVVCVKPRPVTRWRDLSTSALAAALANRTPYEGVAHHAQAD